MAFRILSLLLCLLIAGPMTTSANAIARPENRVGKFFSDSLQSASADLDQTAGPHWESRGCDYDFASGVCKYLYAHADPVNNLDPSGHESLTTTLTSMSIRSAMWSMAIGAPFRAYKAAKQLEAGVNCGTVVYDASIGVLTDGAIGAAMPGLFQYVGRGISAGISAIRGSQAFVRATDSVWSMGAFARGWAIESQILGGTRRLVQNFPVIDDLVNGVATSIKSIDLTAATYRTAANLTRQLEGYAGSLSRFTGGSASYAGQVSVVTANQIEQRVLVVAVEDGAATVAQMQVINDFVNKAKQLWPNIKVLVVPVP